MASNHGNRYITNRPHMPMSERAKIFIPFDPLKGFKEALRQKEIEAEAIEKPSLSSDHMDKLDHVLSSIEIGSPIAVIYFQAGQLIRLEGIVEAIVQAMPDSLASAESAESDLLLDEDRAQPARRVSVVISGTRIPLDSIVDIEID